MWCSAFALTRFRLILRFRASRVLYWHRDLAITNGSSAPGNWHRDLAENWHGVIFNWHRDLAIQAVLRYPVTGADEFSQKTGTD